MVVVWRKYGLAREEPEYIAGEDEAHAREVAARYVIGEQGEADLPTDPSERLQESREIVDNPESYLPACGEAEFLLAWHVLRDAGVTCPDGVSTSDPVIDFIGPDRLEDLQNRFGDAWTAAAEFEFCLSNFPTSSPVYIAAACLFYLQVRGDGYSAGYLLRDLEFAMHGVEAAAEKFIRRSRNAGAKGRESSARKRLQRITDLIGRMEAIVRANPIAAVMAPKDVAAYALRDADMSLWSQGRGQVSDYLGEARRGEVGEDLQNRYLALFPEKAPKRLR